MFAKLTTAALIGLEAVPINVEIDVTKKLSYFSIVGLGDKAVQESKERIVAALRNQGFLFKPDRIVVNLAPAHIAKSGSGFDLAIALAYLCASEQLRNPDAKTVFLGELALDGSLNQVKGLLAIIDSLKQKGFRRVFAPVTSYQSIQVPGIEVIYVDSLAETVRCLQQLSYLEKIKSRKLEPVQKSVKRPNQNDFKFIKGNTMAKRALEIAAVGGHNLLMWGLPGSGKTMLARAFSTILPSPTESEKIMIAKISGIDEPTESEIIRPFRSPHHNISVSALVGGGTNPAPGEVTKSHLGVLFLDELPEFNRQTIDSLRQPIQDKQVTISRVKYSLTYPADFTLVAAMNPCRCGKLGSDEECICTKRDRVSYLRKISGPILDRLDLQVGVQKINYDLVFDNKTCESSNKIRARVEQAAEIMNSKFKLLIDSKDTNLISKKFPTKDLLFFQDAIRRWKFSPRVYVKLLKVAITISCLSGTSPSRIHLAEALAYRPKSIFS